MADDDNGTHPSGSGSTDGKPGSSKSGSRGPSASGAPKKGGSGKDMSGKGTSGKDTSGKDTSGRDSSGKDTSGKTVWTASDRRGPLSSAEDTEIERVVPAHETDAEGGVDPTPETPTTDRDPGPLPEIGTSSEPDGERDAFLENDPASAGRSEDGAAPADPAPVGATEPAPSPRVTADERHEEKRLWWPVAAGVVIGAIIGAGSAAIVYSQGSDDDAANAKLASLTSRVDALDKRPDPGAAVDGVKRSVSDMQGKIAALDKQIAAAASAKAGPANPDSAGGKSLADKIAAMQASLDAMGRKTAALKSQDAKDDGLAQKVASLNQGVSSAEKKAVSAQSDLDGLKAAQKDLQTKVAGLTNAVAGALKEAHGAQSGIETVQSQQKTMQERIDRPALAVVADSMIEQIDAGASFASQVDAAKGLGADPARVAVLGQNAAAGVPSAQSLLAKFKPLVDPIVATGDKTPAGATFVQKMKHGLFGLVSVRRADETTGDDLPSRVALIQSDLSHGDVPGAYDVWSKLPPDAKAKSQAWGASAKTSVEAIDAARAMQRDAIGALGGRKS